VVFDLEPAAAAAAAVIFLFAIRSDFIVSHHVFNHRVVRPASPHYNFIADIFFLHF
jgi:hypothetical protein